MVHGSALASIVEIAYAPTGVAGASEPPSPGVFGAVGFSVPAQAVVTANTAATASVNHRETQLRAGFTVWLFRRPADSVLSRRRIEPGDTMRSLVIGLVAIGMLSACGGGKDSPTAPGDETPGATTVEVFTPGLVFSPAFLTISVGTKVRFVITGVAHDVTFQNVPGAPQSIPVTANQTVERTFNTKGAFPFDCFTHPGMSGQVTVE